LNFFSFSSVIFDVFIARKYLKLGHYFELLGAALTYGSCVFQPEKRIDMCFATGE